MLELDELIGSLPPAPRGAELLRGFTPPARFRTKRFENYRPDPSHPSQQAAVDVLRDLVADRPGWKRALGGIFRGARRAEGVYLDGGFGVGKTHLLAAHWNAASGPKAYLSFDELVYTVGLLGVAGARAAFAGQRLVTIDEWELDDPGNLKLALAFLRGAVRDGVRVVVTSNTLPIELGAGRFSQKDFQSEIEEMASSFRVIRLKGADYRHRQFAAEPGRECFLSAKALNAAADHAGPRALLTDFHALSGALERIHPIRYAALVNAIESLFVSDLTTIHRLTDALRWVHFLDTLYDSAIPFSASARIPLGDLFPEDFIAGPFGKKVSRCLSRMEEMLGERET